VTCNGVSPQNRPLTYSYKATAGTVSGSGTTAEYSSAGAPTGAVGITGTVADDKGHRASADTSLTIVAPPPPPAPKTQALCSFSFATDKRRPTRVDNQAKACLDEIALDLQRQADAKVVIVGESDATEKALTDKQAKRAEKHKKAKVVHFAEQRSVNTKDYLVTEKGIDASRISVTIGTTDGQTAENYLVPAGADFAADVPGTTPVQEMMVKPEGRKPLAERHHGHQTAN
jgi:outer membrane protein OmpA-like peptidoglycan-associated protein